MGTNTLQLTPRNQDCATGVSVPILPPGKILRNGTEEQYREAWRGYIAHVCGSVDEKTSEEVLAQLYSNRFLGKIARNPDRLAKVTRSYAKAVRVLNTESQPQSNYKPQEQPKPRKKPGILKTLACACALTTIGTGVGTFAGNEIRYIVKEGRIDPQGAKERASQLYQTIKEELALK